MADVDPVHHQEPPHALRGVVQGLHHVALAVPSLQEASELYVGVLGLTAAEPELVPHQGVRVQVLMAGSQRIELVEPAQPDSPISRFIEKRGGGIHHLAWRVDSIEEALSTLKARGVRMINAEPVQGSHGTTVAFIHPSSTAGVLMELVQDPAEAR